MLRFASSFADQSTAASAKLVTGVDDPNPDLPDKAFPACQDELGSRRPGRGYVCIVHEPGS
jgi:hypothetical protein